MKRYVLFLAALCVSPSLMACDGSLVGIWQSDATATMSFNRANARLVERQDRFLGGLMGKMTLEFTDKQLRLHMPDTEVAVGSERRPFAGFEEQKPYKVLFCNERMVVIESAEFGTGESGVSTYFLIGADAMWAYVGSNNPKVPDLHIREYFKRVE